MTAPALASLVVTSAQRNLAAVAGVDTPAGVDGVGRDPGWSKPPTTGCRGPGRGAVASKHDTDRGEAADRAGGDRPQALGVGKVWPRCNHDFSRGGDTALDWPDGRARDAVPQGEGATSVRNAVGRQGMAQPSESTCELRSSSAWGMPRTCALRMARNIQPAEMVHRLSVRPKSATERRLLGG